MLLRGRLKVKGTAVPCSVESALAKSCCSLSARLNLTDIGQEAHRAGERE